MILNPQDLRKVRTIAENLNDPARLTMYIHEAETLRLIDAIGSPLYRWLDETNFEGEGPFIYTRPDNLDVTLTKEQYNVLMDGGYYESTCSCSCGNHRTEGLKCAIAYIAYQRFSMNNPINATAFGMRYKDGEFSSRVEDNVLVRNANESRKIGEAYLLNAVDCAKAFGLLDCCKNRYVESPRRIIRVRRVKL